MSESIYLNGRYVGRDDAKVSVFDRGFLFADSVYEVIPYYNGVGFRLQEHIERLQRSLDAVGISIEQPWGELCDALVVRNGGGDQAVYLQITRGDEGYRNHCYSEGVQPTVVAFSYPIPVAMAGDPAQVTGIAAATVEDLRWQRCDIKATALLANVMALQQALAQGAQEALLVRDGYLTEGSACNLLLVEAGRLYTPPRSPFILGGTTRDLVLELATEAGICCCEEPLAVERLDSADELWITSSTRGVVPVVQVDGKPVGNGTTGPVWLKMADLYRQFELQVRQPV